MRRQFVATVFILSSLVASLCLSWCQAAKLPDPGKPLIVHEWGTFTELQDEQGASLTGINVDDEPVPKFVHGAGGQLLAPSHGPRRSKAIVIRHPQVAMRLETPVVYFYLPEGQTSPMTVDVGVMFRGGWLSEFYPNAKSDAPGLKQLQLSPDTIGSLRWEGLQVGTNQPIPDTTEPVWVTPRQTDSVGVTTPAGESERYLFYRGVGNFSGPLSVTTDRYQQQLTIRRNPSIMRGKDTCQFTRAWLVSIRDDQSLAFRDVDLQARSAASAEPLATIDSQFAADQYDQGNLATLKSKMHEALVADGLYPKEATAMLDTWHRAYFQTAGLRLFYLVPRTWTDERMPLSISVPSQMERVMVGRIELISDGLRQRIEQLKRGPVSSAAWVAKIPKSPARSSFLMGRSDFGDLGVEIPADYKRYLALGRFRNALLRAEQRWRPTPELNQFMKNYGLGERIVRKQDEVKKLAKTKVVSNKASLASFSQGRNQ